MNVTEYLISLGYSQEDANALAADEKVSKPIASALAKFDEGSNALTQAEQTRAEALKQKTELEAWWKDQAQPALLAADGGSAAARAEAAQYREYIKSLKEQGYPVPDKWLDSPAPEKTAVQQTPAFDPQKFTQQFSNDTAEAMTKIYDLAEEYRELYGERMPNANGLLAEARQQNKPLTDYVRSKFNFDGKRQEIAEKKIQDRIAAAVKEKEDALNAKMAERSNPNLAPAISSRAAQFMEANKDHADSWKTKVGRAEAKRDRVVQFRSLVAKTA